MPDATYIDPAVPPSGDGCVECLRDGGWWVHLRRCTACGHIGCCESSPSQHASIHAHEAGHPIIQTFEPGESWFWDYSTNAYLDGADLDGVELAPPHHHPDTQPVPGPADALPPNWRDLVH